MAIPEKSEQQHPHPRVIHFTVDGEHYSTDQHEQTPNSILRTFGQKDPTGYYLVQLQGSRKTSYEGQGDLPIHLEPGDRFVTVRVGPTPVSDVARNGVERFMQELSALGLSPHVHPTNSQHVHFSYTVEEGRYAGQEVQLGFIVPPDFSVSTPSGLHVSPRIHGGVASGSEHPKGGINPSPFGSDWEYWSRPHPTWQTEAIKSVGTYMAHIRRLWATQ